MIASICAFLLHGWICINIQSLCASVRRADTNCGDCYYCNAPLCPNQATTAQFTFEPATGSNEPDEPKRTPFPVASSFLQYRMRLLPLLGDYSKGGWWRKSLQAPMLTSGLQPGSLYVHGPRVGGVAFSTPWAITPSKVLPAEYRVYPSVRPSTLAYTSTAGVSNFAHSVSLRGWPPLLLTLTTAHARELAV